MGDKNSAVLCFDGQQGQSRHSDFDGLFKEVYYDIINNVNEGGGSPPPLRGQFNIDDWKYSSDGGLTASDRILLGSIFYNASSVFEFGVGESTQIAAYVGVPRYSGIDSDANWVTRAREEAQKAHFKFYFADIGHTLAWGVPANSRLIQLPLNYQLQALYVELEPFDVYFVDGRYRVACAIASFIHALSRGAKPGWTRVLIHDADRDAYSVLLQIAEIVDRSERLYVLRLKENLNTNDLKSIWKDFSYVVDR